MPTRRKARTRPTSTSSSPPTAARAGRCRYRSTTTTRRTFLPALAVTPDGSRLGIDFYDRRNDVKNLDADRYGASASISGSVVVFGANFRISPTSFPVLTEQGGSTGFFCIHTGMPADATYFYDVFAQAGQSRLSVELARYGVLF
jgi:hypothetical protein